MTAMRVLLVEDEAGLVRSMRKGLSEQSYAVDVASDGGGAIEYASVNPYDAIVLDVMIPPPDGFEVCRRLRDGGITSPILMLTARDAVDDRVHGLDCGADDYLVKPFDFSELLAPLRAPIPRRLWGLWRRLRVTPAGLLPPRSLGVRRGAAARAGSPRPRRARSSEKSNGLT